MPLSPNTVIEERYVITRPLKTGGMGTIYAAVDRRLGDTPCALKELLNREGEEDQALVLRKFEEEMRILASLNHPGIPRVHDYFMHDGTRYIVMDLVDGQNLEELLQDSQTNRGRPLLPTQVAVFALQILEVLQYLHGHLPPIIHRDLKPANVILEKNTQRVKLVDFGLARALRTTGNLNQTAIASLGYAPVEQIQGRATVRSDIYALGASMFHLLTGTVPVPMDAGPVQDANVEIDDELARVVDKATSVDEAERFQSATQMAEALLAWKEGRSTGLPRRRLGVRKTTGKLGRTTLKRLKPAEESGTSDSGDIPVPPALAPVRPPAPPPRSSPWGRVLAAVSVVLLISGVWLMVRGLGHMSAHNAAGSSGNMDRDTPMTTAAPYPIDRLTLELQVPVGWEIDRNVVNMEGDRGEILLRRNQAVMQIDIRMLPEQSSDTALRDWLKEQVPDAAHITAVTPGSRFTYDTKDRSGVFQVRQDPLKGVWRLVTVRMDAPHGPQQPSQMKELAALSAEIDLENP